MDLILCNTCGGIYERGYMKCDDKVLFIVRCPYCGNKESYVVNNSSYSFIGAVT